MISDEIQRLFMVIINKGDDYTRYLEQYQTIYRKDFYSARWMRQVWDAYRDFPRMALYAMFIYTFCGSGMSKDVETNGRYNCIFNDLIDDLPIIVEDLSDFILEYDKPYISSVAAIPPQPSHILPNGPQVYGKPTKEYLCYWLPLLIGELLGLLYDNLLNPQDIQYYVDFCNEFNVSRGIRRMSFPFGAAMVYVYLYQPHLSAAIKPSLCPYGKSVEGVAKAVMKEKQLKRVDDGLKYIHTELFTPIIEYLGYPKYELFDTEDILCSMVDYWEGFTLKGQPTEYKRSVKPETLQLLREAGVISRDYAAINTNSRSE